MPHTDFRRVASDSLQPAQHVLLCLQKPAGAYILFCSAKRPEVKKENPDLTAPEMLKELGALWKAASDADKKVGLLQPTIA